ncbi:hypothetical protein J544_2768 [Acinetobacter baumannii 1461963]|nr:hypothetical protein J544_2768 [Acinetobacter baumannii 1461963]
MYLRVEWMDLELLYSYWLPNSSLNKWMCSEIAGIKKP